MPSAWVLTSIAILAGSFLAGFILYFGLTPLKKQERKKQLEDVLGTVINFIIYIWLGKLLWGLPTLIQDPLAVLAYPSDSKAFYLATLFSAIHLAYKAYKHGLALWSHLSALLYVFIGASFTFEFISMNTAGGGQSWMVLALLFVLLLMMIALQNRMTIKLHLSFIVFLWGAGYTALSFILPYVALFDYMLAWWYFAIFSITGLVCFVIQLRRKVTT
ncbi:hypothetical protein [Lentibacillus saliphilus]|uniref:hypothetical protein n=1 Tax=Lentibacillus saliphilus TaxID=2737028 RepID=UPI001C30E629|nr:hypothetical protein [Lentibacillus saliphilus]